MKMPEKSGHLLQRGIKASRIGVLVLVFIFVSALIYYVYTLKRIGGIEKEALTKAPAGVEDIRVKEAPSAPASTLNRARQALEEADYKAFVMHMREALKLNPQSGEYRIALARGLSRLAFEDYSAGRLNEARQELKEASTLADEPKILVNLAVVEMRLGNFSEAIGILRPFEATDQKAKRLISVAEDARSGRIKDIALDAGLGPVGEPQMLDAVDGASAEDAGKDKKEGTRFMVRFDGGENAVAGHLTSMLLEEAYIKVGADLGYYPEDRIEAILYAKKEFYDTTNAPSWAGAIYDGKIKIPVGGITENTEALTRVVMHEYTHAIVHRLSKGSAPMWINEGIAQYEEGEKIDDDKAGALVKGSGGVLKGLEGSFLDMQRQDAERAYALSLSATAYIVREFGVFSVRKILDELGRGQGLEAAISGTLYMPYEEFETLWIKGLER